MALRQGLRELGYTEGKNFKIEYRGAEGKLDGVVENLVAELVQLNVDVLIVPVLPAILAAKQATKTIPIVMVAGVDSVATGIIDSLARPGGNITGLNTLSRDLAGKRIQLLTKSCRTYQTSEFFEVQTANTRLSLLRNMRLWAVL
jgi:putative tryptophan/tyrosine transport system substrate-binding protein